MRSTLTQNRILSHVLERAAEGTRALRTAARHPHPGRIAYLAAGAVSVAAAATRSDRITRAVKPTLMPLLASTVFAPGATADNPRSWGKIHTPSAGQALLLAGLVGGWLGDITLMNTQSRSAEPVERAKSLNRGAAWFSANQLAYIWLLAKRGARPSPAVAAAHLPALVTGLGLARWKLPKALPATGGYGSLLGATNMLAQDPVLLRSTPEETPEDYGHALGGTLFLLSDALILNRLTLLKHAQRPTAPSALKIIDALTDGAVMATYVIAQLLLVDGINGALHQKTEKAA